MTKDLQCKTLGLGDFKSHYFRLFNGIKRCYRCGITVEDASRGWQN